MPIPGGNPTDHQRPMLSRAVAIIATAQIKVIGPIGGR